MRVCVVLCGTVCVDPPPLPLVDWIRLHRYFNEAPSFLGPARRGVCVGVTLCCARRPRRRTLRCVGQIPRIPRPSTAAGQTTQRRRSAVLVQKLGKLSHHGRRHTCKLLNVKQEVDIYWGDTIPLTLSAAPYLRNVEQVSRSAVLVECGGRGGNPWRYVQHRRRCRSFKCNVQKRGENFHVSP